MTCNTIPCFFVIVEKATKISKNNIVSITKDNLQSGFFAHSELNEVIKKNNIVNGMILSVQISLDVILGFLNSIIYKQGKELLIPCAIIKWDGKTAGVYIYNAKS